MTWSGPPTTGLKTVTSRSTGSAAGPAPVAGHDQRRVDREAVGEQRVLVALQPVDAADHVLRAGDGGDPPAAGRRQVVDGRAGAGAVVGHHRADRLFVAEHPTAA